MEWVARLASDDVIASLRAHPERLGDFLTGTQALQSTDALYLGKEWHAVHYLLTGSPAPTPNPLSFVCGDFEPVGPGMGYGSWYVSSPILVSFDRALSAISNSEIAARYDVDAMIRDRVYIAEGLKADGAISLPYLLKQVDRLRAFAAKGAGAKSGAIELIF